MQNLYIAQLRTRAWQTLKVLLKIEKIIKSLIGDSKSWSSDHKPDALVSTHTNNTSCYIGYGLCIAIKWFQPHTLHVPFILYYLAWRGPLWYFILLWLRNYVTQGLLWYRLDGFGWTRRFWEKGSRTRQFLREKDWKDRNSEVYLVASYPTLTFARF